MVIPILLAEQPGSAKLSRERYYNVDDINAALVGTNPMKHTLAIGVLLLSVLGSSLSSFAVEAGKGFYLLGSKGSLAGILPPEGLFFTSDNLYYSGDASGALRFPTVGGELAAGVDADIFVSVNSGLYVTPHEILGGRLAVGLGVPIVGANVGANATFSLGGVPIVGDSLSDSTTAIGDPILIGAVGWNAGNWHTTLFNLLNVPIGSWQRGALANAGFNRWAYDATLASTYLDPQTGFEFSFALGVTFNGKNLDTGYRSGTEFHAEFAVMQHLSQKFAVGVNGYHYRQITADGGTARADFMGETTAIGPAMNFNFQIGEAPVALKAKYLFEFNTEKRLEGQSFLFQLAMPLWVPTAGEQH